VRINHHLSNARQAYRDQVAAMIAAGNPKAVIFEKVRKLWPECQVRDYDNLFTLDVDFVNGEAETIFVEVRK
jgi:hypothetical protein